MGGGKGGVEEGEDRRDEEPAGKLTIAKCTSEIMPVLRIPLWKYNYLADVEQRHRGIHYVLGAPMVYTPWYISSDPVHSLARSRSPSGPFRQWQTSPSYYRDVINSAALLATGSSTSSTTTHHQQPEKLPQKCVSRIIAGGPKCRERHFSHYRFRPMV